MDDICFKGVEVELEGEGGRCRDMLREVQGGKPRKVKQETERERV